MNEDKVTVCIWWIDHPKLKAVRAALLFEGFYSSDGKKLGGACHQLNLFKIAV